MPPIERLPPQNIETEEAVLGSVLIDPDALLRIKHILKAADFYREKHGWVYQVFLDLEKKREPIDFLTVCDELEKRGQLQEIGGASFISLLITRVPTSINAEAYAKITVELANKRRLIDTAGKIAQLAYQDERDDVEAYTQALQYMRDAAPTGKPVEAVGGKGIDQFMFSALARVALRRQKEEEQKYEVAWPFPSMRRMARWRIGQPAVLIAEGGAGKTTFCTAVGTYNAINGARVFYVATEDEPYLLLLRQLAAMSGITFREIETGDYHWDRYQQSGRVDGVEIFGVTVDLPSKIIQSITSIKRGWRGEIYFIPATGLTVPEIIYELSRLELQVGHPDAVIFDWFLDHKKRPGNDPVVMRLTDDIIDLKQYAHDHDTRLLIASQTGKVGAGKSKLTSYDAFWTSGFAHYGKLVFSLSREREKINGEPIGQFKPEIDVFISKANLDITGTFKLMMRGETFHLYEPEQEERETIKLGSAF